MTVRILPKPISSMMVHYYLGPDHPFKIRVWNALLRVFHYPRLAVRYGEGNGWISVDIRDNPQFIMMTQKGGYEPEVWETLAQFATGDEVFWDVGAHIGSISVKAAGDPRVKVVHSFEPHPETGAILKANFALNAPGKLHLHPFGLSDVVETRAIYSGEAVNSGVASFVPNENPSFPAQVKIGDELIAGGELPAPTLIKLDVEGWEWSVMKGLRQTIRKSPPKAIVFEWSEEEPDQRTLREEIAPFLESAGYKIERIARPSGNRYLRENYLARRARGS